MSTCQHICMCLGGVGGVGSDPQWKLWNPMDPKDEGSPGRGRGRGREHFFLLSGNLMPPRTCLHQTIKVGLRSLRQLVPNSNHQMQSGLISFSHWSHIGLTLVSPHPPRPPQDFFQFCQSSCSERLPALVLFRNVARITPQPSHPKHPKNFANVVRILVSKCCQH
jgi:hypothetical protein